MKTVASAEHLKLSSEIKSLHSTLRHKTKKLGAKQAWKEHLQAKERLKSYAKAMKELAVNHWEANNQKHESINPTKFQQRSRIAWTVNFCRDYFLGSDLINKIRQRELRILEEIKVDCTEINRIISTTQFPKEEITLLDVGSCYNPFKPFAEFDVTAIDIAPAIKDVIECDFLNVEVCDSPQSDSVADKVTSITQMPANTYNVIVFSLLLEYLPTSEQRLKCCEKACQLLTNEGILCIITPDSKHLGVNARLMKTWRYALAQLGLGRIKIEKLEHITCMVFRKCIDPEISRRWGRMHKEPYMDYKIEIPQDFNEENDNDDDVDENTTNDTVADNSGEVIEKSESSVATELEKPTDQQSCEESSQSNS